MFYSRNWLLLATLVLLTFHSFAQWSLGGNSISGSDFLGSTNAANLTFKTNSTARMTIKSDGNVGIGTTNTSGFLLSVDGKMRAREVRINMDTWADFVFAESYKPINLTELEAFIFKNKHLPGIPSEKEVLDSGISVNVITVAIVQKLEETTLYLIELNKKILALEALIQKQQAELYLLKCGTN